MVLQVEMPTAPPTYFESISTSTHLPTYPSRPTPLLTPPSSSSSSLSQQTTSDQSNITIKSGGIVLDLGPRRYSSRVAAHQVYSKQAYVRGSVLVSDIENVRQVDVKVIGTIKNNLTEINGTIIDHSKRTLVDITRTLFNSKYDLPNQTPSSSSSDSHQKQFNFSIQFPWNVQDSETPLPPTFDASYQRATSRVKYEVRIEVKKKGLRRNESLVTEIYYLPSSYSESSNQWEISHSPPILIPLDSSSSSVQLRLPSQKYLPSGHPIHFSLESRDQHIIQLLQKVLSVKVLRYITFNVNGTRMTKETVLGRGEIWGIEDRKGSYVLSGSVTGGIVGGDSAWGLEGMTDVKYAFRIEADAQSPQSTSRIKFSREEPIILTTHETGSRSGADTPAIGMLHRFVHRSPIGKGAQASDQPMGSAVAYMSLRQ